MENSLGSIYNSFKDEIRMPEYGRGIQELIEYAVNIEDDRKRQAAAEQIASMMILLNPSTKSNPDDYRDRVWNHLFRISRYQINVTPPNGVNIVRPEDRVKPEPVSYPPRTDKFRHYGHGIQELIAKAIAMPDGPKKEGFKEVIASYMKLAYKTWNREHFVSDDVVKDDLEILSGGKLSLADGHNSLDYLAAGANMRDPRRTNTSGRGGSSNNGGGRKTNRSDGPNGGSNGGSKGGKRSFSNKRFR